MSKRLGINTSDSNNDILSKKTDASNNVALEVENLASGIKTDLEEESMNEAKAAAMNLINTQYSNVVPPVGDLPPISQPIMFKGSLKSYQMSGLQWLVNLYDQGINGILADEMV